MTGTAGSKNTGKRAATDRAPLTRERVLAVALELVDAEGLDALTRRRLASELDRDAMALYRYAPDRAALLDGIVELVLSELDLSGAEGIDSGDWQAQLRRGAHGFRSLALAHPHVVSLFLTRPISTPLALRAPATLRPLEQLLQLLSDCGFGPSDSLLIYRMYVGFLYGHLFNETPGMVVEPDETQDLLRLGLHRLPVREFPLLRGLAGELAAYDGAAALDAGLDILFAGLEQHFAANR
jgi:AcrR family transcriptional regulator